MIRKPISANSHITEPPNCYVDYIDPAFRDRAPVIKQLEGVGDAFVIEGMPTPVPLGLLAAAGKDPKDITTVGRRLQGPLALAAGTPTTASPTRRPTASPPR